MTRNILVLAVLLLIAGFCTFYLDFSGASLSTPEKKSNAPLLQQKAPNFGFKDTKGLNHSLKDFEGKVIVLNFWASWCAPCVVEFPAMLNLANKTKDSSVFIFLSQDETPEAMNKFMAKQKIKSSNVIVGWDKDKIIGQTLFQSFKLPETYFIDPALLIRDKIVGNSVEWDSPEMQQKIKEVGKPL